VTYSSIIVFQTLDAMPLKIARIKISVFRKPANASLWIAPKMNIVLFVIFAILHSINVNRIKGAVITAAVLLHRSASSKVASV